MRGMCRSDSSRVAVVFMSEAVLFRQCKRELSSAPRLIGSSGVWRDGEGGRTGVVGGT